MKTFLSVAVLGSTLLTSIFLQFSLAAPTVLTNNLDVASSDIKRDANNRNALFGAYICRVQKVADRVTTMLNVRILELHIYKYNTYICSYNYTIHNAIN